MSAIDGRHGADHGSVVQGIGMAISAGDQCRTREMPRVLVARLRIAKLDELKAELKEQNPSLKIETIACDLSDRDATKKLPGDVDEASPSISTSSSIAPASA